MKSIKTAFSISTACPVLSYKARTKWKKLLFLKFEGGCFSKCARTRLHPLQIQDNKHIRNNTNLRRTALKSRGPKARMQWSEIKQIVTIKWLPAELNTVPAWLRRFYTRCKPLTLFFQLFASPLVLHSKIPFAGLQLVRGEGLVVCCSLQSSLFANPKAVSVLKPQERPPPKHNVIVVCWNFKCIADRHSRGLFVFDQKNMNCHQIPEDMIFGSLFPRE